MTILVCLTAPPGLEGVPGTPGTVGGVGTGKPGVGRGGRSPRTEVFGKGISGVGKPVGIETPLSTAEIDARSTELVSVGRGGKPSIGSPVVGIGPPGRLGVGSPALGRPPTFGAETPGSEGNAVAGTFGIDAPGTDVRTTGVGTSIGSEGFPPGGLTGKIGKAGEAEA